jgi:hypothetical protein
MMHPYFSVGLELELELELELKPSRQREGISVLSGRAGFSESSL